VRCKSENKDLEKDDCMWDSMSVDAIKKIDGRENKMKEEIGKYAQGLRDNIEKNNRKNKQLISKKAKEIDKTKITLEVFIFRFASHQILRNLVFDLFQFFYLFHANLIDGF
jgi:hypothetical protein